VSSTRYVGLEFGVHGYKPYRAAQVMARGFGDCKDKANLLVSLLGEIGVRAELALVRTRSRGPIAASPASLEVFNHAIVYVPELDLWLDGTAEHHGSRELPFEDQDVPALRLTEAGPLATRTPATPPGDNSFSEELVVALDPDGRARISAALELCGASFAPAYRHEFEAESNRRDQFAAVVADRFPGATLDAAAFEGLDRLEAPVRVEYRATLPALGKRSGEEMSVLVDRGERLAARYAATASRRFPLEVGPRRVVARRATIEVPKGYRVARLPAATRIETEFGSLVLTATAEGSSVRISRRYELSVYEVAPEAYAGFAAFCRAVDGALAQPLVLVRTP
jgi:hypothetical protein